jgi:hypothetical protein
VVPGCGGTKFIALFDTFNATLPINRVIVGPSGDQEMVAASTSRYSRAIPVTCSATPLCGGTKFNIWYVYAHTNEQNNETTAKMQMATLPKPLLVQ